MKIPAWLHPLHGRDAPPGAVLLAHGTGLLAAASIALVNFHRELSFTPLQWICLVILAWDSAAGIASCLSRPTTRYYASRPDLRWVFISLHFIQPLVILFAFDGQAGYFLFLWLYPLASAAGLNLLRRSPFGRPLAGLLFVAGIIALTHFIRPPLGLEWFGYLFLAKLILCFNPHD